MFIITLNPNVIRRDPPPYICSKQIKWNLFKHIINISINSNIRIKDSKDIEEAVQYLTKLLQDATWQFTSQKKKNITYKLQYPTPL